VRNPGKKRGRGFPEIGQREGGSLTEVLPERTSLEGRGAGSRSEAKREELETVEESREKALEMVSVTRSSRIPAKGKK